MNKQIWHLLVIFDSENSLWGEIMLKPLSILNEFFGYKYVILFDFEGAGKYGLFLETRELIQEGKVFTFQEIVEILKNVTDFDWADFYLFKEYPSDWIPEFNWDETSMAKFSDGLVRAVDSSYIYVYTPNLEVIEKLKASYDPSSFIKEKSGFFDELPYPD